MGPIITAAIQFLAASAIPAAVPLDPCARIAGQRWVSPSEARACLTATPVDPLVKANLIQVVNKTLALHTSTNYQIQATPPYDEDVHEDLMADLARISQQDYPSDFHLHLDIYRSFRRVNDGHCGVYNYCYDSFYVTYLPLPLVLITEPDGKQNIYVAPEAFQVASAEFPDNLEFWQNALPDHLKGKLESLSGARVVLINDQDPFNAVHESTLLAGSFQAYGTRQNSFFSSYRMGVNGWEYVMGNFAQLIHPLVDRVKLTIVRNGSNTEDTIEMPYRSRFGSASIPFTDVASYREDNCRATNKTNGIDLYGQTSVHLDDDEFSPAAFYQQQPPVSTKEAHRHGINVIMDGAPLSNIELPGTLQPKLPSLNQSYSVARFYMLDDGETGVLALGSFSAKGFDTFGKSLLDGLEGLKEMGAQQLIVDTNNGGGYICIAHWLHRIIIGRRDTTEPQAGLDTTARAGPLAQLIVEKIVNGTDPKNLLLYNPLHGWTNASHVPFTGGTNWLEPIVRKAVNGHDDAFSQRLGQECQPFHWTPPVKGLFDPGRVVIVSNGKCASSCSLFSITMHKYEGARTVVVGGKKGVPQKYCGTVGGQSTDFKTMDNEIKTTGLKDHELAPPDFVTNSVQGITWRLGFGTSNKDEPEEWQDQPADIVFDLTLQTVNNPAKIWNEIAEKLFSRTVQWTLQL